MINRIAIAAALLLLASVSANAQDYGKLEVYGGYSYFNSDQFPERENLHVPGWFVGLAGNVTETFGVAAEISGHHGSVTLPGIRLSPEFDANVFTYLVGPRFSARGRRLTGFAHVMFGGARTSVETFGSETDFAMAVGGGIDFPVSKEIAIRLPQVDYLPIRSSGNDWSHNVRIQIGFIYRFGVH